ncbi:MULTISPECIES: TetR family transcriptional regulator [Mycolicibacterium]|uniref:TetR family transcriptional regulator n=1 Tax=Mycolicibacterium austroafricanum TaxID=39687 RepID=A0ABT8HMP9_MYCAO|nr:MULTISPECIES: TetR family transcriptional regulator [Mycolicibacterium]MDN4522025.1 TetR family transcriptional regulator [Mycolicibacterium austroafricanum]MDW5611248.1 TetR family transcriptional regulator [Mycolicibacterium sp. D5.8-2]
MRSTGELRDAILVAARAEFAQYGLAGARIDRIAKAAAASKERLYAHFRDKETLFREVLAADGAEFFAAVSLRPDSVPEFAGDIFDLSLSHPEHFRMINWGRLEGVSLDPPARDDGRTAATEALDAVRTAQRDGLVDSRWDPEELLILLFGLGLAWAYWPDPRSDTEDADRIAQRRAAAVEAASRIVAVADGPSKPTKRVNDADLQEPWSGRRESNPRS